MIYVDRERKTFFMRASLKLSNMLEDRVFDDKTRNDFVDWCEEIYSDNDPYDIAAHVLAEFQRKMFNDTAFNKLAFKPKKSLLSCDFAKSLYSHINTYEIT